MFKKRADTVALGRHAEGLAEGYLIKQGLFLLERNYRCKLGEIDLVMREGETLVFVEVRHRRNPSYGSAVETVTPAKQRKLVAAAQHYILTHRISERQALRFDVVGVAADGPSRVQWLPNAFYGS